MNKTTRKPTYDKRLESRLTALERQFFATLRKRISRTRSASSHAPIEFLDMVADSEVDELAARSAESDSLKIDEIEDALRLLRVGRYGMCERCGKKILARRLLARPFATLCIRCRRQQEREAPPAEQWGLRSNGANIQLDLDQSEPDEATPVLESLLEDAEIKDIF